MAIEACGGCCRGRVTVGECKLTRKTRWLRWRYPPSLDGCSHPEQKEEKNTLVGHRRTQHTKILIRKRPCQNYRVIVSLLQLKHITGLWSESASSDRHYRSHFVQGSIWCFARHYHPKFVPNLFIFCHIYVYLYNYLPWQMNCNKIMNFPMLVILSIPPSRLTWAFLLNHCFQLRMFTVRNGLSYFVV